MTDTEHFMTRGEIDEAETLAMSVLNDSHADPSAKVLASFIVLTAPRLRKLQSS